MTTQTKNDLHAAIVLYYREWYDSKTLNMSNASIIGYLRNDLYFGPYMTAEDADGEEVSFDFVKYSKALLASFKACPLEEPCGYDQESGSLYLKGYDSVLEEVAKEQARYMREEEIYEDLSDEDIYSQAYESAAEFLRYGEINVLKEILGKELYDTIGKWI